MSVPDTTVVYARRPGNLPPFVIGELGSLIQTMKAVLVDGWNETPVMSMTYDGGTGVVTATFAEEHDFEYPQVIEVTGANEGEYNGRWRIAEEPSSHELKFAIDGVPSGDATGDLYMKCGAAGWTMPYINVAGDVAYFEPQHLRGGTYALRVEDTGEVWSGDASQYHAKVHVVSSYTDDATYTAIPHSYSSYWSEAAIPKGSIYTSQTNTPLTASDATEAMIVANPHFMYLANQWFNNDYNSTGNRYSYWTHAFGYLASARSTPDAFMVFGHRDTNIEYETNQAPILGSYRTGSFSDGFGGCSHSPEGAEGVTYTTYRPMNSYIGRLGPAEPVDGKFRYRYPVEVFSQHSSAFDVTPYIGVVPGLANPLHDRKTLPWFTVFDTEEDGTFIYVPNYQDRSISSPNDNNLGALLLNLTGPWPTGV